MRVHLVLLCALLSCVMDTASATPITYSVSADTSSISVTMGSLDFNFNPGPLTTQAASLQILGFSTDGSLGSSSTVGDASGALPGTLTFDNATAFNDYFQTIKFGSNLTFDVSLYGPALSSPDGVSTSGSTFAFSLFSDPAGTIPVLTTDTTNGFAYTVDVNLDGSTTATNFLTSGPIAYTPEPGSGILSLTAIALGLAMTGVRECARRVRGLRNRENTIV
jgi:hypothetical protein